MPFKYKKHMMYGNGKSKKANTEKEHRDLEGKGWSHNRRKMKKGGKLKGPSHDKGGIDINVEGGEYIIKKDSVNKNTLPILEEINKTGAYKGGGFVWPSLDARKRRAK